VQAVDDPAPCLVGVFLEVALDVVGFVMPPRTICPSGGFSHCVLLRADCSQLELLILRLISMGEEERNH
jgi:hypothetical protein